MGSFPPSLLILGHLTLLWLTPERVFGKWLRIGIPIEQCARTWSGDRLHHKSSGVIGVSRVSPAKSFFKKSPPPGGSRPQALTTSSQATGGSRPHALLCNICHHPQPPSKCKGYYRICQEVYLFLFCPRILHYVL